MKNAKPLCVAWMDIRLRCGRDYFGFGDHSFCFLISRQNFETLPLLLWVENFKFFFPFNICSTGQVNYCTLSVFGFIAVFKGGSTVRLKLLLRQLTPKGFYTYLHYPTEILLHKNSIQGVDKIWNHYFIYLPLTNVQYHKLYCFTSNKFWWRQFLFKHYLCCFNFCLGVLFGNKFGATYSERIPSK